MKRILISLILTTAIAVPLAAQIADGDQHWAARAEGAQNGRAKATEIDAAIAAYNKAVAAAPNDLEARWKLLRALRFKGQYQLSTTDEKKALYATAKTAGEQAVALIDKQLAGKVSVSKATEKQVADATRA